MRELWWFIHILGISLWLGVTTAGLIAWPSGKTLRNTSHLQQEVVKVRTLIGMLTKSSHIGAGLTALGGVVLSFLVRPKSELGSLWLTFMQGAGVVAFVISTFVMTRKGKRLLKQEPMSMHEPMNMQAPLSMDNAEALGADAKRAADERDRHDDCEQFASDAASYRGWLFTAFLLLFLCLFMAAFKFTLH